jgi:hypothetical protein
MGRADGSALVWQGKLSFAVIGDSGGDAADQDLVGRIDEEADDVLTAVREYAGHEQERQQQAQGREEAKEGQPARKDSAKLYPTVATTPRFDTAWDVAYLTAVTADKPNFDAAQRRALRRWIARGGILVVFLDQVDNERMGQIIGEAWTIEEVDRLTLTTVKFQDVPGGDTKPSFELGGDPEPFDAHMSTEKPIAFTRVVAPDWRRHLDVNNWPALLSKRLGRGMLVAITVGGRAWTVAPTLGGADGKEVVHPGTVKALDRLSTLLMPVEAQAMAVPLPGELLVADPGRDFLTRLIGYEVVSRRWVALVLGLYLGAFLLGGVYWHRRGIGERLGLAAVGLAALAAAALVVLGVQQRGQVPASAASLQLAEVQPGLGSVRVTGPAALYQPQRTVVTVTGRGGGWVWPVELSEQGDLQRLRTDDLDRWVWTDLQLSAGVPRPLDVSVDVEVARPFASDLRYTAQGLTGTVDWPTDQPFEDLLLTTPQAALEPKISREDEKTIVTIGPKSVLPSGVFYTSSQALLSQEQQDRAALMGRVLRVSRFDGPTLLGWSPGLDLSYDIQPELERVDRALWAAPLRIEPIVIPWPLIPMQQVRAADPQERFGFGTMPLYQPQGRLDDSGERLTYWINGNNPSGFIGRFMVPTQVLPLKLSAATIHLNIQAIGRPVRILAIRDGKEAVELATLIGPDGPQEIPVPADKLEALTIDGEGGVLIAFDVKSAGGADQRATGLDMWQVRHFGLEVAGTVQKK